MACPPLCGDLQGYGGGASGVRGGGSKKVAYSQVGSGPAPQEWGFALGQIGKNLPPAIQFHGQNGIALPNVTATSRPPLPTDKISAFALSTDGFLVESVNPTITGPPAPGLPTDYFIVHCHAATSNCTDPTNWTETQLTTTSFNMENAPVARGFFTGDYQGLAAAGNEFRAVVVQATTLGHSTAFSDTVGP